MHAVMLSGNTYNWTIRHTTKLKNKSSYHIRARKLLKELFPASNFFEEVPIKIYRNKTLYLDFFIPFMNIAIEVHGRQHYEFASYFHQSKLEFIDQKRRDRQKQEWCELNNIRFIILPYNETDYEWSERINQRPV